MGTEQTMALMRERMADMGRAKKPRPSVEGGSEALVLLAAQSFPASFTFTDLVVACHARYPEQFALPGRSDPPDARAVHCRLYGRKGLLTRGKLIRGEEGRLRVAGQDPWLGGGA